MVWGWFGKTVINMSVIYLWIETCYISIERLFFHLGGSINTDALIFIFQKI